MLLETVGFISDFFYFFKNTLVSHIQFSVKHEVKRFYFFLTKLDGYKIFFVKL